MNSSSNHVHFVKFVVPATMRDNHAQAFKCTHKFITYAFLSVSDLVCKTQSREAEGSCSRLRMSLKVKLKIIFVTYTFCCLSSKTSKFNMQEISLALGSHISKQLQFNQQQHFNLSKKNIKLCCSFVVYFDKTFRELQRICFAMREKHAEYTTLFVGCTHI